MNRRWLALAVLCISLLVIVVDNTIVNVTLPTLVGDLHADIRALQWVVDAYTLVFAGLLLLAGTLGDRFGRRRALIAGLVVFAVASMSAALAGGVAQLVAARAVMGAGAACIMPATLSLLTSIFTDTRERTTAIGIWAATAGVGVALGPVAGGMLLDHFSWGAVFVVNVPIAVAAIAAARILVPESRAATRRPIDWLGAALSCVALVTFVWGVIEAPGKGWTSPTVVTAFAFALGTAFAFAAWERRATEPLLDLGMFKNARFAAASGAVTILFFGLFGFLFVATQYLQFVLGYSPLAAGVHMLPYAFAMMIAAPSSSKLVERFGTKRVATAGMTTFAAGVAVAATATATSGYGPIGVAFVLMGIGMGLAGAPATESIMSALPPDRAGIGSAVNDTTRELGGALGVAVVGSIVSSIYGGDVGPEVATVGRDVFVHAMTRGSMVVAGIAAAGAMIAWRFLPNRDDSDLEVAPVRPAVSAVVE